MRIRLKLKDDSGNVKRINALNAIDNVVFEENLIDPSQESIAIFFKGKGSSGILNLKKEEARSLINSLSPYMNLVKAVPIKPKRSTKRKAGRKKKSK